MYQTLIQKFQTDLVEYSTQSTLIIQNSCSIDYPIFCHNDSLSNVILCVYSQHRLNYNITKQKNIMYVDDGLNKMSPQNDFNYDFYFRYQ